MSALFKSVLAWIGTQILKLGVKMLHKAGARTMFDVKTPLLTRASWKDYVRKQLEKQRQEQKQRRSEDRQ